MSSLVSVLSSSPEEAIVDSPGFAHLFVALRGTPLQPAEREQLRAWLATINDAADCDADRTGVRRKVLPPLLRRPRPSLRTRQRPAALALPGVWSQLQRAQWH